METQKAPYFPHGFTSATAPACPAGPLRYEEGAMAAVFSPGHPERISLTGTLEHLQGELSFLC